MSKLGPPIADVTVMCWGQLTPAPQGQWPNIQELCKQPIQPSVAWNLPWWEYFTMEISTCYTSGHPNEPVYQHPLSRTVFVVFYLELSYFEKRFLTSNLSYALPGCTLSSYFMATTLSLLQAHVPEAHVFLPLHSCGPKMTTCTSTRRIFMVSHIFLWALCYPMNDAHTISSSKVHSNVSTLVPVMLL